MICETQTEHFARKCIHSSARKKRVEISVNFKNLSETITFEFVSKPGCMSIAQRPRGELRPGLICTGSGFPLDWDQGPYLDWVQSWDLCKPMTKCYRKEECDCLRKPSEKMSWSLFLLGRQFPRVLPSASLSVSLRLVPCASQYLSL